MRRKNAALMVVSRRLLRGARILGEIWRKGGRCGLGWARECDCESPTDFCGAKLRWLGLIDQERAAGEKRDWTPKEDGPDYIISVMKVSEAEATKVKLTIDILGVGEIQVGPGGNFTWKAYKTLAADPDSMIRVQHVLKFFPGSTVS